MTAHNPAVVDLDWLFNRCHPIPFSGCWAWNGRLNTGGYAQVMIGGRHKTGHRLAYEARYGPIPADLQIDHLCRVRCCINPNHLEAVTCGENIRRGDLPRLMAQRNITPEMRAVLRQPKSPEHAAKLRALLTAHNQSPEMRAIVSQPKSPERAAELRAILTVRNRTPEMRALTAARNRARSKGDLR